MKRDFSGWGVLVTGGLLTLLGVYWLLAGWEHIQIERGWSQFIAGAMLLSGGVVTMAIGRLIRLLVQQSRSVAPGQPAVREPAKPSAARSAVRPPEPEKRSRPPEPVAPVAASASVETSAVDAANSWSAPTHQTMKPPPPVRGSAPASHAVAEDLFPEPQQMRSAEPVEVDHYTAGEATYVMYSDGSVEVRTPDGAQRYESLEALRANSRG